MVGIFKEEKEDHVAEAEPLIPRCRTVFFCLLVCLFFKAGK